MPDIASREEFDVKRAAFAATIGNMLEFYDFITYSFFATEIGRTFFPAHSEYGTLMLSLATFGAGFLTRPIGGIVLGISRAAPRARQIPLIAFRRPAMNLSTVFTLAAVNLIGLLGLFLAARAVDGGISLFGFVMVAVAVLMTFVLLKRHFDGTDATS